MIDLSLLEESDSVPDAADNNSSHDNNGIIGEGTAANHHL